MSTSYDKIHNQTTKENMTLTHASAECQCYEMSVNLFKPGPISDNFWSGVSYSLGENDWERFIEQFGTHYVYEVVMENLNDIKSSKFIVSGIRVFFLLY